MYKNEIKIDAKMKTRITNDWLAEFPEYVQTHPEVFRKRVGPLLFSVGYDFPRVHDEYRPACWCINLINSQGQYRVSLKQDPGGRLKNITWKHHERGDYKEAIAKIKELAPIPLEGNVTLSQVIEGYKKHQGQNGFYLHELEDPILISAWAGKISLSSQLIEWAIPIYEAIIQEQIEYNKEKPGWFDMSEDKLDSWVSTMRARIADRENLKNSVEEQVVHHKLTKVPYQELIID